MVNGASGTAYDVLVDGARAGSVSARQSREFSVSSGSHVIELRYSGSALPALVDSIDISRGQRRVLECSRDCSTERIAGLQFTNASRETTYEVTFGGRPLGTLAAGATSKVVVVPAGFDRLDARPAGTNELACSGTISANACTVGTWSCNRDLCEIRRTGKVRLTNGYARTAILEISGARIVLAPSQTTEPIIQPAGQVEIRLRDANTNAVLCGGLITVVQCQTKTYVCQP